MTRPASRSRAAAGVALAAGLALLSGCTAGGAGGKVFHDPGVPPGLLRLVAFDSCADLLNGFRSATKAWVGSLGAYAQDLAVPEKGTVAGPAQGGAPAAGADGAARANADAPRDSTA